MSLFITSLNSGSNGNCYYVGNNKEAVLVDVGISCREVEKRMARLQLSMQNVKAIFISHEHTDHIRGVSVLAKKYKLSVYITQATLQNSRLVIDESLVIPFKANESVAIGELNVTGFPKLHDAADPHSFIVEYNGICVGVLTDIGSNCDHVIKYFSQCHAAFLEANYDEDILREGHYPYHLKQRISSGHGHLSNTQALELFTKHKPEYMSHVILSHLSSENNSPTLVDKLFKKNAGDTKIIVASRHYETDVFRIQHYREIDLSAKRAAIFQSTKNSVSSDKHL